MGDLLAFTHVGDSLRLAFAIFSYYCFVPSSYIDLRGGYTYTDTSGARATRLLLASAAKGALLRLSLC